MVEKFYLYRVKLTNTPIMRRIFYLLFLVLLGYSFDVKASDTVFIHETQIPVLIERQDNVLFYLRLDAKESKKLDEIILDFSKSTNLTDIQAIKLYYGGTEALQDKDKNRFAPVEYISSHRPGGTLAAIPSYSIKCAEVGSSEKVVLKGNYNLFPGVNYFWISLQMKKDASLQTKILSELCAVKADGKELCCKSISPKNIVHRMAVGVRHAGDDGSASFRIPGLVTTNKGTLLGVYDVRYNSSVDLQEYVDVGLSRSIDGGKNWEKMRLPLSFGEYGGLPKAQNGVGDPSILVDTKTNTVWVVAAWTHGMGNQRAWWSSHPGMDLNHTAQLVLAKSTDDGKTWSKPINITEQVKDPSWYFLLQGPGRGITMSDGTLVFPTQFIDSTRVPNAGIMYSKDRGKTWKMHNMARTNTTEALIGYCYAEMGLYEKALFFLEIVRPLNNIRYNIEYINCLANSRDIRAINTIHNELNQLAQLKESEITDGIIFYHNFLRRRRAYTFVDMGRLDDAEEAFKEMLNEDANKEYANGELEYIQELKKLKGINNIASEE